MIEKASIYTRNALNKSSEFWHTSVNHNARPAVEGEHDKSWNDHELYCINELLANDVLLVSKLLLDNEEALWPPKIGDKSFWLFLSYLITTVFLTQKSDCTCL